MAQKMYSFLKFLQIMLVGSKMKLKHYLVTLFNLILSIKAQRNFVMFLLAANLDSINKFRI